jgi:hypothetical protein
VRWARSAIGAEQVARGVDDLGERERARGLDRGLAHGGAHDHLGVARIGGAQQAHGVEHLVAELKLGVGDVALDGQERPVANADRARLEPEVRRGRVDLLLEGLLAEIALVASPRPEVVGHDDGLPALLEHHEVADRIGPERLEARRQLLLAFGPGDGAEERLDARVPFLHRAEARDEEHHHQRDDAELENPVRELQRVAERARRGVERLAQRLLAA